MKWFIQPKPSNNLATGDGFKGIEKIDNWVPAAKWADLVITTSNDNYLERLDFFRKQGVPVFGPTQASAKLDGMKALETVPYETFASMDQARKHVEKTSERYVFKTVGEKPLTYCSRSPADMVGWIDRMVARGRQPKGQVILQKFIEGIEMAVSRFLGSEGWVGQWNESFETPGGDVAYFTKESKLGEDTLAKLEETLVKTGHTGNVTLELIIDESGKPWPLEWTCRMDWPVANITLGATEGDPIEWMKDALEGKDTSTFKEEIGCCIVVAHSDYKSPAESSDVPIYGMTKGNKKHIHPQFVKIDVLPDMDGEKIVERPTWNTTGSYAAVVTGFGRDVKQSTERACKTVAQIHLSGMIVRDDIGEELEEQLPKLHEMGYAKHCEFEVAK